MRHIKVAVAGKVNLNLKVLAKQDNMHLVDMILASIDLFDEIEFCPMQNDCTQTESSLSVSAESEFDDFDEKIMQAYVVSIASKFESRFCPVLGSIKITKNIPYARGLGGSSAVAVALLLAFGEEYGVLDQFDNDFLMQFGADVPFVFKGGFAHATHFGEEIEPVAYESLQFILLCPKSSAESKDIYAELDRVQDIDIDDQQNGSRIQSKTAKTYDETQQNDRDSMVVTDTLCAKYGFCNDLTQATVSLNSDTRQVIEVLKDNKICHMMTGSGSGVIVPIQGKDHSFVEKLNDIIVGQLQDSLQYVDLIETIPCDQAIRVELQKL